MAGSVLNFISMRMASPIHTGSQAAEFAAFLQERLQRPLPGMAAQLEMAPRPKGLRYRPNQFTPTPDARHGAVLVGLYTEPRSGALATILTLRPRKMRHHGGQLSYPGGGRDAQETPEETALREAHEEVALPRGAVELRGRLSQLYIPPTNNLVTPVVGTLLEVPPLTPNPREVEQILHLPLARLLEGHLFCEETRVHRGVETCIPQWRVHDVPLWGATAMITAELLVLYREFLGHA